jgi:hypothetical protein
MQENLKVPVFGMFVALFSEKLCFTFSDLAGCNEQENGEFKHIENGMNWSRFAKVDRLGHVSRRGYWTRART